MQPDERAYFRPHGMIGYIVKLALFPYMSWASRPKSGPAKYEKQCRQERETDKHGQRDTDTADRAQSPV